VKFERVCRGDNQSHRRDVLLSLDLWLTSTACPLFPPSAFLLPPSSCLPSCSYSVHLVPLPANIRKRVTKGFFPLIYRLLNWALNSRIRLCTITYAALCQCGWVGTERPLGSPEKHATLLTYRLRHILFSFDTSKVEKARLVLRSTNRDGGFC
jgi:hypothetical protein